jgi:hypothetical protein
MKVLLASPQPGLCRGKVLLVGTHLDSLHQVGAKPQSQEEVDAVLQRIQDGLIRSVFSRSRFGVEMLRQPPGLNRAYFAVSSKDRRRGDLRLLKEVSPRTPTIRDPEVRVDPCWTLAEISCCCLCRRP